MIRYGAPILAALLALSTASCGSENSSSGPAVTSTASVAVTEAATTEPVTTQPSEPAATDPTESPTGRIEIDDDPLCQAFARVYAASFFQGLAGMFGSTEGAVEKIELYFAPALASDVAVVRAQGSPGFQGWPTLERIDAGNVALKAAGFTDAELLALVAAGNDTLDTILAGKEPDVEKVKPAPDAEAKLSAAAVTFLADVGTIDEYFAAKADPTVEAAFTDAVSTQCPLLFASFDSA